MVVAVGGPVVGAGRVVRCPGGALPAGLPTESRRISVVVLPSASVTMTSLCCEAKVAAPRMALPYVAIPWCVARA